MQFSTAHAIFSSSQSQASILTITLLLSSMTPVDSTVELQVLASNGCIIGTIHQPSSCTRCVCGLLNLMLCTQTCNSPQDSQTTNRPSGNRPTGPTVIPILVPANNRRPVIQFPSNITLFQLLRPLPG